MTKTRSMKRFISLIAAMSIMLSAFCVFGGVSAAAATNNKVKLYSSNLYFCKYGINGTDVYIQTKDNAANQQDKALIGVEAGELGFLGGEQWDKHEDAKVCKHCHHFVGRGVCVVDSWSGCGSGACRWSGSAKRPSAEQTANRAHAHPTDIREEPYEIRGSIL